MSPAAGGGLLIVLVYAGAIITVIVRSAKAKPVQESGNRPQAQPFFDSSHLDAERVKLPEPLRRYVGDNQSKGPHAD